MCLPAEEGKEKRRQFGKKRRSAWAQLWCVSCEGHDLVLPLHAAIYPFANQMAHPTASTAMKVTVGLEVDVQCCAQPVTVERKGKGRKGEEKTGKETKGKDRKNKRKRKRKRKKKRKGKHQNKKQSVFHL